MTRIRCTLHTMQFCTQQIGLAKTASRQILYAAFHLVITHKLKHTLVLGHFPVKVEVIIKTIVLNVLY